MARIARVVIPGYPYHVVQRGNRSQKVIISGEDKKAYLEILSESAKKHGLKIWAYCLMDNHVHLIVVHRTSNRYLAALGKRIAGIRGSSISVYIIGYFGGFVLKSHCLQRREHASRP